MSDRNGRASVAGVAALLVAAGLTAAPCGAAVMVAGTIVESFSASPPPTTLRSYSETFAGSIQREATFGLPTGPFNTFGRHGSAISGGGPGFVSASAYADVSSTRLEMSPGNYRMKSDASVLAEWSDFIVAGNPGGPTMVPLSVNLLLTGSALFQSSTVTDPNNLGYVQFVQANFSLVVNDQVAVNGSNWSAGVTNGGPTVFNGSNIFTGFTGTLHTTSTPVMVPTNTPFSMRMSFIVFAETVLPLRSVGTISANIDFGHTASFDPTVTPFVVPDGYTINSVSAGVINNTYNLPSPSAAPLLGFGGLIACARRRRR